MMGQLGTKLRTFSPDGKYGGGLAHWCPACEEMHGFATLNPQRDGARWTWDGNVEHPTFKPSMNISIPAYKADAISFPAVVCHYVLNNGLITFTGDCTHALAGKTVPLPELPEFIRD